MKKYLPILLCRIHKELFFYGRWRTKIKRWGKYYLKGVVLV